MKAMLVGLVVRHGLGIAGALLASRGLLDEETIARVQNVADQLFAGQVQSADQVAGIVAMVGSIAWSIWQKWQAAKAAPKG